MSSVKLLLAMLFSLVALAGCGGGGGGGTPAATYGISGTVTSSGVALSGATVALSGAATASATTDASGNYSFPGLANGSYTVTPSKTGYAFTPVSSAVSVSGSNVTGKNFTAATAATTYGISGTVNGASGVTLTLSGANSGSVVSGAGGAYTFPGLAAGSYTVTPSLTGYTFSPASIPVTITAANSTGNNFTATAIPVPHSISGTVSGAIAAGVTITVTGAASPAPVTTDSSGNYTVTGLDNGNYTVTPSLTGYTFNPSSTAVTLSGANVSGKNFTSTANAVPTYTLSGVVSGPYVAGVKITLGGAGSATTTTNSSGNYSFTGLVSGTYTVTPSLAGYTYSPAAPSVALSANTTQNFTASSAITSSSVSGTISYAGTQTGGIHIRVHDATCTSDCTNYADVFLPNQGGAFTKTFTINGVQQSGTNGMPANYVLQAFIGAVPSGAINASDPQGKSATFTTTAGTNATGLSITVADKTPAAPTAPTLTVSPGPASALVRYKPATASNGQELATSYTISWGTTSAATGGTATFTANGTNQTVYAVTGLTDGQQLYFKMTATNGTGTSAASSVVGPVTIGAPTGQNTVSGTVTFTGTATGPMIVGVYDNSTGNIYYTTIAAPVSGLSYSVAGIPNGTYNNFAWIDMNQDNKIDAGDISNTGNNGAPSITVSGNTTGNITLSSAAATVKVNTDHQFDGTNNNYALMLSTDDGTKHLVGATLISGPNLPVPWDMGPQSNNSLYLSLGPTSPTVGDTYTFQATYSDGSTGTLTASVGEVLGQSSMAQTLVAQTTAPGSTTVPNFTWAAPASAPASYTYNLNLYGNTVSANWNYPNNKGMPSSQTSVLYNFDGNASPATLTTGTYTWQIQVRDANGNSATRQTTYTVP